MPRPDTIAVHAGRTADPQTGAVAPGIVLSTTFARHADGQLVSEYLYSRERTPNRSVLEEALAALDDGREAAAFASGSAATAAVFMALSTGDHVVLPADAYYGTRKILIDVLGRWGLRHSVVDMRDLEAVERAVTPATKVVWVETPSNPTLTVTDISAVAAIAHKHGAKVAVDNTWGTPIGQRVLQLGADLAMYSTTKYHGGHTDVLSGALVTRDVDEFWSRVRTIQTGFGAVPSPFDAWLVHRGLASLPTRFRQQCASALHIATELAKDSALEVVHYPGLVTHPGHAIAARQMLHFGAMISIQVRGDAQRAIAVAGKLKLITRATSLGGVESLIEHRKTTEGPTSTTPDNLLRISIGLEDPLDLLEDLWQAIHTS